MKNSNLHLPSITSAVGRIDYIKATSLMELKAQVDAYGTVFLSAGSILLLGAILALFIKVRREDLHQGMHVHVE